jgi:hypothetical protein
MKGALYDQRRHRIDILRALSHCANNIIADMEGKMKQKNLFGEMFAPDMSNQKYSSKIEAPIYEPKNIKPHLLELCDETKTRALIREIKQSMIPDEEKEFLIRAAKRHLVFNYEKIADYYAHSSPEMQDLMEKSGLVIIDFYKAIEYGFIKLSEDIQKQYLEEYGT